MKSSVKGARGKRHSSCLIVDGYNIVALKHKSLHGVKDLETARQDLIDSLAGYQSFTGEKVILVFDAYRTSPHANAYQSSGITVVFTQKGETADERIERLVYELRDVYQQITVATSDYAEQQVVFGGGALRISAADLGRKLRETKGQISLSIRRQEETSRVRIEDTIRHEISKILEKWRRE